MVRLGTSSLEFFGNLGGGCNNEAKFLILVIHTFIAIYEKLLERFWSNPGVGTQICISPFHRSEVGNGRAVTSGIQYGYPFHKVNIHRYGNPAIGILTSCEPGVLHSVSSLPHLS